MTKKIMRKPCVAGVKTFFLGGGDHLKIHAKTTISGATPSEFCINLVNFGPFFSVLVKRSSEIFVTYHVKTFFCF